MKDTHLYQRLSNNVTYRSLYNFIRTQPLDIAGEAMLNITRDASDHPKYNSIKQLYEQRLTKND